MLLGLLVLGAFLVLVVVLVREFVSVVVEAVNAAAVELGSLGPVVHLVERWFHSVQFEFVTQERSSQT